MIMQEAHFDAHARIASATTGGCRGRRIVGDYVRAKPLRRSWNVVDVQGSQTEMSTSADPSREVIWCYHEARVCSACTVRAHGTVVSVWTAIPFPIKLWAPDRIIAERELVCGLHETWLIDRLRKTAEYFGASCLTHQAYHWTIQGPLF
jgi:hypothetical protein